MTTRRHPVRVRSVRRGVAVPKRFHAAAPSQSRGHATQERFAGATEALLRDRPFEEITIQDIVRRARKPIGSFYARFGSKEALLPLLYRRYDARLETRVQEAFARVRWEPLDFAGTVGALVDVVLALFEGDRGPIRTLSLFARAHPEALPADLVARRRRIYEPFVEQLSRHRERITHPDPDGAIRFGLYVVVTLAREKLLFSDAPQSRIHPMGRDTLRAELIRALLGYLGGEVPR